MGVVTEVFETAL